MNHSGDQSHLGIVEQIAELEWEKTTCEQAKAELNISGTLRTIIYNAYCILYNQHITFNTESTRWQVSQYTA